MDGGASIYFYLASAAAAAGTAITTIDTINSNRERERVLEAELRANDLKALDDENQRLIALREANDQILANSGGIEAYASPSLIAARAFNFRMGMDDISNIRLNQASEKAGISARISILRANSKASLASGIFEVAGIALGAAGKGALLKKDPTGGTIKIHSGLGSFTPRGP